MLYGKMENALFFGTPPPPPKKNSSNLMLVSHPTKKWIRICFVIPQTCQITPPPHSTYFMTAPFLASFYSIQTPI